MPKRNARKQVKKNRKRKPAKRKPITPPPPPPPPPPPSSKTYSERREQVRQIQSDQSKKGREIGPLPPVVDPARRERGRLSLRSFGLEYFPKRFRLPNASSHDTAIAITQRCTDDGGKFACAMPRGTGKTSWAEVAVIRAVVYGIRRFPVLVCATGKLAARRLKAILRELETNDLLLADFPEVCYPIRCLERIHNRARGQTLNGEPTRIEMTVESLILPTVAGSVSSGAVIQVASMEGAIRGLNVSGPAGESMRPDMVLL